MLTFSDKASTFCQPSFCGRNCQANIGVDEQLEQQARRYGAGQVRPVSAGGLDPSFTVAPLAPCRKDFTAGLRRLRYRRESGSLACRAFELGQFRGCVFHAPILARHRPDATNWQLSGHCTMCPSPMFAGARCSLDGVFLLFVIPLCGQIAPCLRHL